ncbi:hypothetical protein BDV30DRAFT_243481 [Aspergillus minisclerotigenes]|uniref:Fungal-type protein kinase domain-containing protein n=1 Tax=Aspergillus minisclerotigenes TaxID=656917 RepID=A0A5N6IQ35_9EURO|nr:hypothetical protein BDV30DRAFT_243481 [Aspergillus minisclerotigenes]
MDYSARAQGLITFANLPVYEKARIIHFPPPVDYVPPKEPIAVQCLANVLNKVVFGDERFNAVFVNSHAGPHENSNEYADIAVSYVTEEREIKILCFVEAKHTQTRESYLTRTVEERALKCCRGLLHGDSSNQAKLLYAGTLIGTHLRLWIVHRAQQAKDIVLTPLWGSPLLGSNEDYADLGDTKGGPLIEKTFHDIILLPPEQWVDASMTGIPSSSGGGVYQLPGGD